MKKFNYFIIAAFLIASCKKDVKNIDIKNNSIIDISKDHIYTIQNKIQGIEIEIIIPKYFNLELVHEGFFDFSTYITFKNTHANYTELELQIENVIHYYRYILDFNISNDSLLNSFDAEGTILLNKKTIKVGNKDCKVVYTHEDNDYISSIAQLIQDSLIINIDNREWMKNQKGFEVNNEEMIKSIKVRKLK